MTTQILLRAAAGLMVPLSLANKRKCVSGCTHSECGKLQAIALRMDHRVVVLDETGASTIGYGVGDELHMTMFDSKMNLIGTVVREQPSLLRVWVLGSIKGSFSKTSALRTTHHNIWGDYAGFGVIHTNDNFHTECSARAAARF